MHEPNRIECGFSRFVLTHIVEEIDDGAVQLALHTIHCGACVPRFLPALGVILGLQTEMGHFHQIDRSGFHQIQTVPRINDRSQRKRFGDAGLANRRILHRIFGPVQSPFGIAFPEVDTRSQPIVIIRARLKRLVSSQNSLTQLLITAVITQNPARRSHFERYRAGNLPVGVINPCRTKNSFARAGSARSLSAAAFNDFT